MKGKNTEMDSRISNRQLATFYIVRHGQTEWNKNGLMLSFTDIPLNSNGELQAKELAKKLKCIHYDAVISSDMSRARQTAEIIALERKLMVKTYEALRERSFGKFEGNNRKEYLKLLKDFAHLSDEEKFKHTGGGLMESLDQATSRFLILLREVAVAFAGKTVLVVS